MTLRPVQKVGRIPLKLLKGIDPARDSRRSAERAANANSGEHGRGRVAGPAAGRGAAGPGGAALARIGLGRSLAAYQLQLHEIDGELGDAAGADFTDHMDPDLGFS